MTQLMYKIEGQHLFILPPPQLKYAFEVAALESELHALMNKYRIRKLTAEVSGGQQED